jgi:hypothetical protein
MALKIRSTSHIILVVSILLTSILLFKTSLENFKNNSIELKQEQHKAICSIETKKAKISNIENLYYLKKRDRPKIDCINPYLLATAYISREHSSIDIILLATLLINLLVELQQTNKV